MNKAVSVFIATLAFIAGAMISTFPHLEGAVLEWYSTSAVESFQKANPSEIELTTSMQLEVPERGEILPARYPELYKAMQNYNQKIYLEHQEGLSDPWTYEDASFDLLSYGLESDVFGVLTVPKLNLEMPVYLGANYENMAKGLAHLSQTSLPIGGDNTNCVIAGHRGWASAPYFLNLNQLSDGDEVLLRNIWETLKYEVSEIEIVEPDAVDKILIKEGSDLLTLMTCHPPASGGRFRYLVLCKRVKESFP